MTRSLWEGITLQAFGTLEEAFAEVNDSRFGLQVGEFSHDLQVAFEAHAALEVDGVVIGDVPSYQTDQMPWRRGRSRAAAVRAWSRR